MYYHDYYGYHRPRKRKYHRFWTAEKTAQALYEAKNYGLDYVNQKYGTGRVQQIQKKLNETFQSPGRGKVPEGITAANAQEKAPTVYVKGRGKVKVGWAGLNAPPKPKSGMDWLTKTGATPVQQQQTPDEQECVEQALGLPCRNHQHNHNKKPKPEDQLPPPGGDDYNFTGTYNRVGFQEGGPDEVLPGPDGAPFAPGTYKPLFKMNLENDEELAQGYQTPWAQPTSISSTITGLLRESQNATANFWDQFMLDKGGQYALDTRGSGPFGTDVRWTPDAPQAASSLAATNPFGAFGTSTVMESYNNPAYQAAQQRAGMPVPEGVDPNTVDWTNIKPPGYFSNWEDYYKQFPTGTQTQTQTEDEDSPPPMYGPDAPILGPTQGPSGVYNPWGFGEGADTNAYGPSPQYMADATLQSLALANAYFAPQRMELAYELGDMETDMRRLAVNLGRQVDDPVLQAKLFKEASRAVRTLDVQQNTFAFQMAEQRRREELQNFQYYDKLAQEEYQTYLQNRLNEAQLELQGRYYGLQRWNVMHPPSPTGTTTTPGATPSSGTLAAYSTPPWKIMTPWAPAQQDTLAGLYGNLLKGVPSPYTSSLGRSTVTRTRIPI